MVTAKYMNEQGSVHSQEQVDGRKNLVLSVFNYVAACITGEIDDHNEEFMTAAQIEQWDEQINSNLQLIQDAVDQFEAIVSQLFAAKQGKHPWYAANAVGLFVMPVRWGFLFKDQGIGVRNKNELYGGLIMELDGGNNFSLRFGGGNPIAGLTRLARLQSAYDSGDDALIPTNCR